jgi:D-alanyl-D-alanine carboxypeptidase
MFRWDGDGAVASRRWRCAVAACVLAAGSAPAQAPSLDASLRQTLADLATTQGFAGATAAVSIDGHVTSVAVGYADRERNVLMTPAHRMMMGSAAKPFFAFVALSLAAEGKLDLDAPISRWLGNEPWFSRLPNADRLTMRHLLTHRGGIPNHVGDSAFATMMRTAGRKKRERGFTAVEQIALVLDKPAPYRAGDGFTYTDTGYLLAALEHERAASS